MLSKESEEVAGRTINRFEIGDSSNALKFFMTRQSTGYFIRFDNNRKYGLDVKEEKYNEGNEVYSWFLYRGNNQLFFVNHDKTISPSHAPHFVLGY